MTEPPEDWVDIPEVEAVSLPLSGVEKWVLRSYAKTMGWRALRVSAMRDRVDWRQHPDLWDRLDRAVRSLESAAFTLNAAADAAP